MHCCEIKSYDLRIVSSCIVVVCVLSIIRVQKALVTILMMIHRSSFLVGVERRGEAGL